MSFVFPRLSRSFFVSSSLCGFLVTCQCFGRFSVLFTKALYIIVWVLPTLQKKSETHENGEAQTSMHRFILMLSLLASHGMKT